ncbi:MAG: class I SAM-dependent methyltransferase [Blastocatellia bacterium]|nr:class I SAM-dependent methyltransferase [Blastocatellia bacterium]
MNRDSYNAIAEAWDDARSKFSGREREYLEQFLDGLPVPSSLLDLGCGTGRPIAEYLLERGNRVTGVDQSREMLAIARARLPSGTWIEQRIEEFDSAERFDGIVCWDALFHIERSLHETLIRRMARMLVEGGRLILTFGGSDHPAFTDTMFGETFFYDSHPPEVELNLLRAAGFEFLISEFTNVPTGGRDKGRYAVVGQLT